MKRRPYKEIVKDSFSYLNVFETTLTCLLMGWWIEQLDRWFTVEISFILGVISWVLCQLLFLRPFTIMKEETKRE